MRATTRTAVSVRATWQVTADQPERAGRCRRKKKEDAAEEASDAAALAQLVLGPGGREERSLVALGLKGMTATAPRAVWIHVIRVRPH